jgi:hypothetical protein
MYFKSELGKCQVVENKTPRDALFGSTLAGDLHRGLRGACFYAALGSELKFTLSFNLS